MILLLLAYLGGVLTILSPCILPVLPFVFSQAGGNFRKNGLPLLLGMAATFTLFSSLVVVGGTWVTHASDWGRTAALFLMTFFGFSLIFPGVLEKLLAPVMNATQRMANARPKGESESSLGRSLALGAATGLLWAPCAGPVLGLILTGAALQTDRAWSIALLFAYALGAATSLALALAAGGKFLGRMKKYLKADRTVKTGLGVAVLLGVVAIAFHLDRAILTQLSRVQTEGFEKKLISLVNGGKPMSMPSGTTAPVTRDELYARFAQATPWLNSPPLTAAELKGKVVLVDFWTYSCINCLRTLPYVKAWAEKYQSQGLVVIGVHTPEFAFEKKLDDVTKAVRELGLSYPIAIDNDYKVWNSFKNEYWPAHYFIDRAGMIRHTHSGEGDYEESEKMIQSLLGESAASAGLVKIALKGVAEGASDEVRSPETYLGSDRSEGDVIQPEVVEKSEVVYRLQNALKLNQWSIGGAWTVNEEEIVLGRAPGRIAYRFHARDLNLVHGPGAGAKPVRFRVRVDGRGPGDDHGLDTNEEGEGTVRDHRLYQLLREKMKPGRSLKDHTFEIEFLDPGVAVYAFTFG